MVVLLTWTAVMPCGAAKSRGECGDACMHLIMCHGQQHTAQLHLTLVLRQGKLPNLGS